MIRIQTLSFVTAVCVSFSVTANAQPSSTCGQQTSQLQAYAAQVNQIANFEYYQGIRQRCGWNDYCANMLLQQLNQWYYYQSSQINSWYQQLAAQCTTNPSQRRLPDSSIEDGIDEDAIEDLQVDDRDQTVVLRIPDNPRGFNPR